MSEWHSKFPDVVMAKTVLTVLIGLTEGYSLQSSLRSWALPTMTRAT